MTRVTIQSLTVAFAAVFGSACATPPLPAIGVLPNDNAPLIEGTNCREATPVAWTIDTQKNTAKLGETGVEAKLPPNFVVSQERPELLVLGGMPFGNGPKTRFELFATPKCDTVVPHGVLRRMAIRALQHRYRPVDVAEALERQKLRVVNVPPGLVIEDGDLLLRDAEVSLALFYTPVVDIEPLQIVAAAGCPRNEDARRACEKQFRQLVQSVKVVAAPPPTPEPAPDTTTQTTTTPTP